MITPWSHITTAQGVVGVYPVGADVVAIVVCTVVGPPMVVCTVVGPPMVVISVTGVYGVYGVTVVGPAVV